MHQIHSATAAIPKQVFTDQARRGFLIGQKRRTTRINRHNYSRSPFLSMPPLIFTKTELLATPSLRLAVGQLYTGRCQIARVPHQRISQRAENAVPADLEQTRSGQFGVELRMDSKSQGQTQPKLMFELHIL